MAHHTENLPMLCLKKGKKIRPMPRKAHEFRDFRGYLNWSYTPNKKGTQTGAFFIWFELASDGSQPPAGGTSASLKCGRNLRFPHKRPLPYRKKGTEQEIHNAPITRSKTDMSLWRKDYDSAAPDRSLRNELRLVPGLSGQRACLPWMRSWQRKKSLPELFNPKM